LDDIEVGHHAILFVYKADKQKYIQLVEHMENDVLRKRNEALPQTIADACRVLAGWKNHYGNRDKPLNDANDMVAFMTTGAQERKANKKKGHHMFHVKKPGYCSNEGDEEETVKTSNKKILISLYLTCDRSLMMKKVCMKRRQLAIINSRQLKNKRQ